MINHKGTVTLLTQRLMLREFVITDYVDVCNNWSSNPAMADYVLWTPNKTMDECKKMVAAWIEDYKNVNVYKWAIEFKNEVIGFVEVRKTLYSYEIGYLISSSFWKNGFAYEAVHNVCEFLFKDCNFQRIFAVLTASNLASESLVKKINMIKEGTLRKQYINKDGSYEDLLVYGILKEEWIND